MLTISSGLIIDCDYSIVTNWNIPTIYTCTARVIFVGDSQNVSDVSFNHMDGKDNSDVKGIIFKNQVLNFAPANIESFFPNLESYDLSASIVEELRSEHLRGLSRLKEFRFDKNNLRIIESNLFRENPLLTWISFEDNPVRHVGHRVFDELQLLHTLSFHGHEDACTNQSVSDNRTDVDLLLFQLIVNCPPTFEMTQTRIVNGVQLQTQIDKQITDRLDPITMLLLQIEENQRLLAQRVDVLEGAADV